MNNAPGTPNEQELLPLLVLAPRPPGSQAPLAKTEQGDRSTLLYRSQFGYDCRLDGQQDASRKIDYGRERSWFGWMAAISLLVAVGLLIFQPNARAAVAGFFTGNHPSHPATTPQPTSTAAVLGVSDPSAAPATAPKTQTVTLSGSYAVVSSSGAATTNCNEGVASDGKCVWTITHPAGQAIDFNITWSASGTYSVSVVEPDGTIDFAGSSSGTSLDVPLTSAASNLTFTIVINNTMHTNFSVAISNK